MKQNSRIRHQLQRIATEFRDFAHVQKQLTELLNAPFPTASQEVFDAISHDPAAMTGHTRRLRGWKAVEEVHCRINRQQDILSNFATTLAEINSRLPRPTGIFDESLKGLMGSLSRLEHHQEDLRNKESEATQKLAHVRELHVLTKIEFNDTLGHTSHIYPEVRAHFPNWVTRDPHGAILAVVNIRSRREVQEQVPEVLGDRYGSFDPPARLDHSPLEEPWQDDRNRHSRLPNYPMVSQRVYGTTKAVPNHQLAKTIFQTLAGSAVIRHRVSRLSVSTNRWCSLCHFEWFYVPVRSKPRCGPHPPTLHDRALSCHVGGRHLRILHHYRASWCCFVVVRLVGGHFLMIPYCSVSPFFPFVIPSHYSSSALSCCQSAFMKSIGFIHNIQHT